MTVEEKIRRCEEQMVEDLERGRDLEKQLDEITRAVESGDGVPIEHLDDDSIVQHVEELREKLRAAR